MGPSDGRRANLTIEDFKPIPRKPQQGNIQRGAQLYASRPASHAEQAARIGARRLRAWTVVAGWRAVADQGARTDSKSWLDASRRDLEMKCCSRCERRAAEASSCTSTWPKSQRQGRRSTALLFGQGKWESSKAALAN
jgi:hypothetical protein